MKKVKLLSRIINILFMLNLFMAITIALTYISNEYAE